MSINNLGKVKKEDCALIIIDMQYDFLAPGAPIECPGGRDIIPNVQKLRAWAKEQGIPVIYTQEEHRKQKMDFGMELERSEPEHCLAGTKGVEIVSELAPESDDYVVVKRRYSGFYLTDLAIILQGLGKSALIVTGAATNICVFATVLDAHQRDLRAIVAEDCVAGTSRELHQAFLKNIDYVFGDVVKSAELMRHFSA